MQIEGISAIVTGGASGLGYATAARLIAGGARVALLDLPGQRLDQAADTLGALAAGCDVADPDAVSAALDQAVDAHGVPRIAVSCAGIVTGGRIVGREGPADLDSFERTVRVNLIGTFNVMRLAAHRMTTLDPVNDDGERGVIVNTASIAAFEGQIGQAAYAASKGGVAALSLPAAREFAQHGIRVAAIAPGLFHTPMMDGLPEDVQQSLAAGIPFPKRLGKADEFAATVQHIIENTMINGACLRVDGAIRLEPK